MSDISVTVVLNALWLWAWQRALTTSALTKSPIHWQICNRWRFEGRCRSCCFTLEIGRPEHTPLSLCEVIFSVFDLTVLGVCMNPVYSCVFKLCGFWPSLFLSASWPALPGRGSGVSWRLLRSVGLLLGSPMWGWSCRRGAPCVWKPRVLRRERGGKNVYFGTWFWFCFSLNKNASELYRGHVLVISFL